MKFSVLDKCWIKTANRHHHPPGNQESVDHGAAFKAVSVVVDELRSGGFLISAFPPLRLTSAQLRLVLKSSIHEQRGDFRIVTILSSCRDPFSDALSARRSSRPDEPRPVTATVAGMPAVQDPAGTN